jgi:hypothetical protein
VNRDMLPDGIWTRTKDGDVWKPASECSDAELILSGLAKARHKDRVGYGPFTQALENYDQEQKLK